ncbi:MAG: purine-nucleoside phosphorylase [Chloroflexi bacterium]|jgi:purine-nucleoside phosphorylase|nr:MAG: purine-nucleoside phosphorylase [Chloroflexota bacterium]
MAHQLEQIQQAVAAIQARTALRPRVGIILGSGLGALADELVDATVIRYTDIPGFPQSTVHGHRGELAIGLMGGTPVVVMRGRFHFYEGYDMHQVTLPVRVMQALGCTTLLATNAAGGLRPEWPVGDLVCVTDHIFMPGMAGHHPLRGPNDERLGVRFPAMLDAYDPALRALAHDVAATQGTTLRDGVYIMLAGPSFETGAELRMCQRLGADVVGMSTAPEAIVARHGGMNVLAISLVTNQALPDGSPANHEEVIAAGDAARPRFGALLTGIVARL